MQGRSDKTTDKRQSYVMSLITCSIIVSVVALNATLADAFTAANHPSLHIQTSKQFRYPFGINGQRWQANAKKQSALSASASPAYGDFMGVEAGGGGDFSLDSYTDLCDTRYSASDWIHIMKTIPKSSVLRSIKGPLVSIVSWSFFVSLAYKFLIMNEKLSWFVKYFTVSPTPHSLLVSSLGLLLVFRTNSAYQRFAEGRRIWEQILSTSRNISRLTTLYEAEVKPERRRRIQRLLAAFPYLLRHQIQPCCLSRSQCKKMVGSEHAVMLESSSPTGPKKCWVDRRKLPWSLLPNIALKKIAAVNNKPLWICDRLSKELMDVEYTPNFTSRERLTFLSQIDKLSKCVGECERIHQTAVPLNYARHSLRGLTIWLFSLPFTLVKDLGFLTGPVMGIIAWLLLGVYEIGYSIEDPFQGSLRLNSLCEAIHKDVMYGCFGDDLRRSRGNAFRIDDEEVTEWEGGTRDAFNVQSNNVPETMIHDESTCIQHNGEACGLEMITPNGANVSLAP